MELQCSVFTNQDFRAHELIEFSKNGCGWIWYWRVILIFFTSEWFLTIKKNIFLSGTCSQHVKSTYLMET